MKRYATHIIIQGQQVQVSVNAKSYKQAAEKIGHNCTPHFLKTYAYCDKDNLNDSDNVVSWFDGGMLFRRRHDLQRIKMPLSEMEQLIALETEKKLKEESSGLHKILYKK